MEQVEAICDRVGIINRGQLVALDNVEGLRAAKGAGETLYLQVKTLSEAVLKKITDVDGVEFATIDDGQVRVTVGDRSKFEVLDDIDEITTVEDFSVVTSSLGDLFIQYTNETQEVQR